MSDESVQTIDSVEATSAPQETSRTRETEAPAPVADAGPAAQPQAETRPQDSVKISDEVGDTAESSSPNLSWSRRQPSADGGGKTADEPGGTPAEGRDQRRLELREGQTLRRGSSGDKVRDLQDILNQGGAGLQLDGKLGPRTQEAIQNFQREHGLKADGIVGPQTLRALNGGAPPTASQGKGAASGQDKGATRSETAGAPPQGGDARQDLEKLPAPLRKYADAFQRAGEKYGIDPRFLAAISMHETGGGRSSAFRNKNNAMGISGSRGPLRMSSVEASIDRMARGLANPNGYYRGRNTIADIGRVYAPVGAGNDPRGLNNYWTRGVSNAYRQLGGDPSRPVLQR